MTDADLIAALGWEPCEPATTRDVCNTHGSRWLGEMCEYLAGALAAAEDAMDIAREGIAAKIEAAREPRPKYAEDRDEWAASEQSLRFAAGVAREWQP